ncbi:MAG TPA: ABC transporter permease [Stellaceae bacterium]|jgi:osmoprotectant transport system permease protein|nr:ABC transporter permease [Stellaceae bacterium]
MRPRNRVLFVLTLAAIVCCALGGFLSEAPNRLVSGQPITLWQEGTGIWLAILALALLLLAFLPGQRCPAIAALIVGAAALLLLVADAGRLAMALTAGAPPATRVSLDWAFWAGGFCLVMIVIDALQRLHAGYLLMLTVAVAIVGAILALAFSGNFNALSLAREYASRRGEFATELGRHCLLVLIAVMLAVAIGAPLGLHVSRRPQRGAGIFGALNLLQTIPSVALFGLLIAPLSALGIGGIGAVPAIIALVLYSLLPVARNTEAGIAGIDRGVIDAARGMGLTPGQILWRIELPLGMPTFLAGLRIVTVQAIGLTIIAALIGAGGLGSFVFQGIGQYAIDLVLLGALPTIVLALAADFILALLAAFFERRPA